MDKTCKRCGKLLGNKDEPWDYCDGVEYWTVDAYQYEIFGDETKGWHCAGGNYEVSQDI